jgi:hypothetical protein
MWGRSFALVACVLLVASTALADTKDEARALAAEGIELYENGSFAAAIERLQRADALYRAPVHGVYVGRALGKLGRLLEAEEVYRRSAELPVQPEEPATFETSRKAARDELAEVRKRIPTVRIEAREEVGGRLRVLLDDNVLDGSKWSGVRVDPGPHVMAFQLGDGPTSTQDFTAEEGSEKCLQVNVVDGDNQATPAPSTGGDLLWPGLAFGIGGLGLVLGGITGGIALAKAGDVKDQCPNDVCPTPDLAEDAGTANTLGSVALASLITGGVGVVLGTVLILVGGDDDTTQVEVQASPFGFSLRGRF